MAKLAHVEIVIGPPTVVPRALVRLRYCELERETRSALLILPVTYVAPLLLVRVLPLPVASEGLPEFSSSFQ